MTGDVSAQILEFLRERFLDGDPAGELTESTPLLQFGVLNSLNTAILIDFLQSRFDIAIDRIQVTGRNFKNVDAIAALVAAHQTAEPSTV